ncbi:MAG: hypothetical protein JSS76_18670 [Bacteroidetes bacterium]|nr:hypothetical protein [Bacteroidota bacterium]MBS1686768.1 hypothetical protein [Bacteroidota bacterium]
MKIRHIGRIMAVAFLLSSFLYSTVVRELHYSFSVKYHTEAHDHQCDHHIHSTGKEDDCSICKIDVNHIYDHEQAIYSVVVVYLPRPTAQQLELCCPVALPAHYYLRGPPYLA